MIYVGILRVAQKVAKETTEGVKCQLKAEDNEGNKITLIVEQSNFKVCGAIYSAKLLACPACEEATD
jgi:hypothetical protein